MGFGAQCLQSGSPERIRNLGERRRAGFCRCPAAPWPMKGMSGISNGTGAGNVKTSRIKASSMASSIMALVAGLSRVRPCAADRHGDIANTRKSFAFRSSPPWPGPAGPLTTNEPIPLPFLSAWISCPCWSTFHPPRILLCGFALWATVQMAACFRHGLRAGQRARHLAADVVYRQIDWADVSRFFRC